MSLVAVIGERVAVQGYGLAGALVLVAEEPATVHSAWWSLPEDVGVVILSREAAKTLAEQVRGRTWPLVAVMT